MTPIHEEKTAEHHAKHVKIHINRTPIESPDPTKGHALYVLGEIPTGHQLYREVQGDEEDEPIFNGHEEVELRENEHFYSSTDVCKGYTIVVNALPKTLHQNHVTFEEIVELAFPKHAGRETKYTVSYYNGPGKNPEGSLTKGKSVKIKNKMVFDVTATNKS
jgi:hypothetical protein